MVFLILSEAYDIVQKVNAGFYSETFIGVDEEENLRVSDFEGDYPFIYTPEKLPPLENFSDLSSYGGNIFFATKYGFWVLNLNNEDFENALIKLSELEEMIRPNSGVFPEFKDLCPAQVDLFNNVEPFIFFKWDSLLVSEKTEIL